MSQSQTELWNAWRGSPEIREMAEAWITKNESDWTDDHEQLVGLIHSAPDQALAVILAIMQLTDDLRILGGLGAGPLEDFLGVHGEDYVDTIRALALEHRRMRVVLDDLWQGAMSKQVWHRIEVLKQSANS